MNTPLVTVVVPTVGRAGPLERCLESLAANALRNLEVIVVGDCPTFDVGQLVGTFQGRMTIRYERLGERGGPSRARNRGAQLGSGRLIAFLDDDTVATEQWAAEGVRAFEGVPDVVGLVGRTALPPGEGKNPFLHFMVQEREGSFPACNMWVRRDSFWKSGGFSPDFFDPRSRVFHHEDSDFAFRLQELGKVVFSSAVVAFHPACPAGLLEPIRMSRKAYFDALLARKHPRKYAELMTKRVGFLSLPNPRVKARFLLVALALGGFACALAGYGKTAWGLLAMGFVCLSGLVALRTDFRGLLRMSLVELVLLYPVTLAAAFMFVGSLVRGMIRFRRLVW